MPLRIVLPALLLLAPLACGCERCDDSLACFAMTTAAAAILGTVLGVVCELRVLASLTNIR